MARFTRKFMVLALSGLLLMPGVSFAGGAPQYNTSSPMGSGGLLGGINVGSLAQMNGLGAGGLMGNLGDSLLQTVVNAAVSQLTTQLLGQIGGMGGMMGGMMQGGMGGMMQGGGFGQNLGGALSQGNLFGGIQGGLSSGGGFGGLIEGAANAAVASVVQTGTQMAMDKIMGGMQGGGSSGGGNIGRESGSYEDTNTQVTLRASLTADPQSENYGQGVMDAVLSEGPNPAYMIDSETWDTDYIEGYKKGLAAGTQQAALE